MTKKIFFTLLISSVLVPSVCYPGIYGPDDYMKKPLPQCNNTDVSDGVCKRCGWMNPEKIKHDLACERVNKQNAENAPLKEIATTLLEHATAPGGCKLFCVNGINGIS